MGSVYSVRKRNSTRKLKNRRNKKKKKEDETERLSPITVTFEMEPQLHNVVMELATESFLVRVFPFTIDDFESNVFVRRSGTEAKDGEISVIGTRSDGILRCGILVDQVRIENVELVALYDLRRRVIHIVVSLVVFVPFKSSVNAVEVSRFAGSVLIGPEVHGLVDGRFH